MTSIRILALAGIAAAIGSIMLLYHNYMNSHSPPGSASPQELEEIFKGTENLQEVQLFLKKYPDVLKGFSQNQDQITYNYTAFRWIDLDGDGNRETFRQLTLSTVFDKSLGDDSKPKQLIASCSFESDENLRPRNLGASFYDWDVMKYLQRSWCIPA